MSEFICVSEKWYSLDENIPTPDCGGDCPPCRDDEYIVPPPNERILENEFGRSIDSVILTEDYNATNNEACKNLTNSGYLRGNIVVSGNIRNKNQDTDAIINIVGDSGSNISSYKSLLKIIFEDKKGNVILDGFFTAIEGTIENDLKLTYGTYIKLSGDLIVDRLINEGGFIERNGFNLIVKNDKYKIEEDTIL